MQSLEQDLQSHVQEVTEHLQCSEREKHALRQQLMRAEDTIRRNEQEMRKLACTDVNSELYCTVKN